MLMRRLAGEMSFLISLDDDLLGILRLTGLSDLCNAARPVIA
jgi:hypothetical protein